MEKVSGNLRPWCGQKVTREGCRGRGEWEPGLEVGEAWLVRQPSDPEASRAKALEGESDSPYFQDIHVNPRNWSQRVYSLIGQDRWRR